MTGRQLLAGTTTLTAIAAAGVWSGLGPAGHTAAATGFAAKLSAAQEVPKPRRAGAAAQGSFAAALVRSGSGGTLTWKLTFRGLTGRATASHIHLGVRGRAGGVLAPICGPCRSGARGSVNVNAKTIAALLGGTAYVNVHTARNAAGEIRGQLAKSAQAPAPSPAPTTTGGTTTDDGYPGG